MPSQLRSEREFEEEVIRTAHFLWPQAVAGGRVTLDGRERDGVFVTEEALHIVECTVSRSKQKAIDDISKSTKLARSLRPSYRDRSIQCWFITADEPTADQRGVATSVKEFLVQALSFSAFRGRLIDADGYLAIRANYAFGSARNLADDSTKIPADAYVPLDLLGLSDSSVWSVSKLTDGIVSGGVHRSLLLADYGAGKSMTLREIYLKLVTKYRAGKTSKFPVFLNLRDHSGQTNLAEVLERHARNIGFPRPDHLVRAWRAGYVTLLLDGFDELSSTGWMMFNRRLRQVRFRSVEIVRLFMIESPRESCVLVSGRESYFDRHEECINAVCGADKDLFVFSLNDFTEEQISKYVQKYSAGTLLPEWMPSRPLLVGYLLLKGTLSDPTLQQSTDIGSGWDYLLTSICKREGRTHADVDVSAIRNILEHLATMARIKGSALAPLNAADLSAAFRAVVGIDPDERAETLLMRLPGLGPSQEGDGSRAFVDMDFASACAAGDVVRFIEHPFGAENVPVTEVKEVLSNTGALVAYEMLDQRSIVDKRIYVALKCAIDLGDKEVPRHELAVDVLKIVLFGELGAPATDIRAEIREAIIDDVDLTYLNIDISRIVFRDCWVLGLYLPRDSDSDRMFPRFVDCQVEYVDGRSGPSDVASDMFVRCKFDAFSENILTNAAVDSATMEPGVKVLVTILRKLFIQKGGGRKENAFFRGVVGSQSGLVQDVLQLVQGADYATRNKRGGRDAVWTPNRRMAARVNAILSAPHSSHEGIIAAARLIGARH